MDNQHQHIKGYRDLTAEEIALMNEGKALAEQCGEYIEKLRAYRPPPDEWTTEETAPHPGSTLDQRWISIGATDLQRGFMAVIRGIAKPTNF